MTAEIKKWYYSNGKIELETPYLNGVINGIEKWYSRTGEICKKITYKNGVKIA